MTAAPATTKRSATTATTASTTARRRCASAPARLRLPAAARVDLVVDGRVRRAAGVMRRSRARAGARARAAGGRARAARRPARSRSTPAASGSASPSSELTKTSSRSPGASARRASTSERRSAEGGTCTVTSAYFAALRIVELRMVSEASFSFGITSRALSSVRMKVYMSPISSTAPSTPPTSTQSPSRSGCVNAIISPATKLPSVRCAAKPMIRPEHRRRREQPARDRAHLRDHEQRREQRRRVTIPAGDRPAQDAVARHRLRRAVGAHDPPVDQPRGDQRRDEHDPDHEQALPRLHAPRDSTAARSSLSSAPSWRRRTPRGRVEGWRLATWASLVLVLIFARLRQPPGGRRPAGGRPLPLRDGDRRHRRLRHPARDPAP